MCFASLTLRLWRMFSVAMVSRVMILLASCVLSAMGDANDVLAACLYCQGGVPFSIYQPSALRSWLIDRETCGTCFAPCDGDHIDSGESTWDGADSWSWWESSWTHSSDSDWSYSSAALDEQLTWMGWLRSLLLSVWQYAEYTWTSECRWFVYGIVASPIRSMLWRSYGAGLLWWHRFWSSSSTCQVARRLFRACTGGRRLGDLRAWSYKRAGWSIYFGPNTREWWCNCPGWTVKATTINDVAWRTIVSSSHVAAERFGIRTPSTDLLDYGSTLVDGDAGGRATLTDADRAVPVFNDPGDIVVPFTNPAMPPAQ